MPWEKDHGKPDRIDSALDIMLEGPIGAAAFNNEFGRPCLTGYFRTFEAEVPGSSSETELRGYHKPIMLAGGLGNIRPDNIDMREIPVDTPIIVLGGPAMLIGLGGGAASSMASGTSAESLDFASVQRGNPEMERRAQEVIDRCWQLGDANPIAFIHDVGAGGISNALPELVDDVDPNSVPEDDTGTDDESGGWMKDNPGDIDPDGLKPGRVKSDSNPMTGLLFQNGSLLYGLAALLVVASVWIMWSASKRNAKRKWYEEE